MGWRSRSENRERDIRALQPVCSPAADSDKGSETVPIRSKKADLRGHAGIEGLGRSTIRQAITGASQFECTLVINIRRAELVRTTG